MRAPEQHGNTHQLEQTLIVTIGCGLVQREGGPIEEIHPGDVVWLLPGEKHWYDALLQNGEVTFRLHLFWATHAL